MRVIGRLVLAVLPALFVAGCVLGLMPAPADDATPSPENLANGPNPPPGPAMQIEDITISEDHRTVELAVIGGPEYDPENPCSSHYFGWAHVVDGLLLAKVVDDTPPFANPNPNVFCTAEGHDRRMTVELEEPYEGGVAHDVSGRDHLLRAPAHTVSVPLPEAWKLVQERDAPQNPLPQWYRMWSLNGNVADPDHWVSVFQTFGGAMPFTDKEYDVRDVTVNGAPGRLFSYAPTGSLMLVWLLEGDGIELDGNVADFSPDQLIELAEAITRP
jgi:hypothetical protein